MMLIMLAGLQSQPSEVLEAAKVDGASAFGTFRQLTLPHLRVVHGARHAARHDLPDPGVRPDRRDDRRRPGLDEHPVLRVPAVDRRRLGVRQGVGVRIVVVVASIIVATIALRVLSRSAQGGGDRLMGQRVDHRSASARAAQSNARAGHRRLARRAAVLLPRVLDACSAASRRSRTPTPARSCSSARRSTATSDVTESTTGLLSFREAFLNSFWIVARQHDGRARAGHPGRLRAGHPAGAEVARRAVLLHLHEVPARRRVDPAAVDPGQGLRPAEHPPGADDPLHRR